MKSIDSDKVTNESEKKIIEDQILAMYKKCYDCLENDRNLYYETLEKARVLSEKNHFLYGIEYYRTFRAFNDRFQNNYDETINFLEETIRVFQMNDNYIMIAFCCNCEGELYYDLRDYENAYKCFKEAIMMLKNEEEFSLLGKAYSNLANVLNSMKNYEEEIEVIKEALDNFTLEGQKNLYQLNLLKLSNAYSLLDKCMSAKVFIDKLNGVTKINDDKYLKAYYYIENGRIYICDGLLELGNEVIDNGIALAIEQEASDLIAIGYYYKQIYYKEICNIEKRIEYLKRTYYVAKVNFYSRFVEKCLKELIDIYKKIKAYKAALFTLELLHQYKVVEHKIDSEYKIKSLIVEAKLEHLKETNNDLMELASIDGLTGVYNRRFLIKHINELSRHNRYSILLIDVDNFKHINDEYGHLVGDEVLKEIVKGIKSVIKDEGVIGRYGGDEFIVLLYKTDLEYLNSIVNLIKTNLKKIRVEEFQSVSISGGLVKDVSVGEVEDALLSADKLLYDVKMDNKDDIYIR